MMPNLCHFLFVVGACLMGANVPVACAPSAGTGSTPAGESSAMAERISNPTEQVATETSTDLGKDAQSSQCDGGRIGRRTKMYVDRSKLGEKCSTPGFQGCPLGLSCISYHGPEPYDPDLAGKYCGRLCDPVTCEPGSRCVGTYSNPPQVACIEFAECDPE